jgi:hypothetical protein
MVQIGVSGNASGRVLSPKINFGFEVGECFLPSASKPVTAQVSANKTIILANFPKMKVGLSNHQPMCGCIPTNNF